MLLDVPTAAPFSFQQSLAFIRRFPPCQGDYVVEDDSVTAAITVDERAHAFTLRAGALEIADGTPRAVANHLVERAVDFVGALDDVTGFYAAAEGDAAMERVIERLYGLHHVRFLTLEEIAVYSVMMQRAPVTIAATLKRRFLDHFGTRIEIGDHVLRAMPSFAQLSRLSVDAIANAIGHRSKATRIVDVVRGVAALGRDYLRAAPYADARDALLAIPGLGPFSAGAILLRGLGRMDELPWSERFDRAAAAVYRRRVSRDAIARRYGRHIGYWSFYMMNGGKSRTP